MTDAHISDFHDRPTDEDKLVEIRGDPEAEFAAIRDKCEVDPIKAQDDALISVALKLRGQVAVNDLTVDENRSTMIRSNYAPDWTQAHWDHPLLANMRKLSCLSSSDLPSSTKRGLVDERKAIERVSSSEASQQQHQEEDDRQLEEAEEKTRLALAPASSTKDKSGLVVSSAAAEVINCDIADPEAIQRAVEHGVNAVFEVAPFVLRQKALLELSSETISSDPQLLALVSAVAQANKNDPAVAGKVAMGETPTIPVTVLTPAINNVVETRRKATDALPKPHAGGAAGSAKGFHASDIVAYDDLRNELSPPRANNNNNNSTNSASSANNKNNNNTQNDESTTTGKSMHDVGYKTWAQKRLEHPSQYEDMERYAEYREQVTTLEGKSQAMVELASRNGVHDAAEQQDE